MPNLTIRPATQADIPAATQVAAAAYQHAFAHILEPEILATRTPASFAPRFAADLPNLHLATRSNTIIGFSLMTNRHIDMMFVTPHAHRTGAGAALLTNCESRGANSLECFRDNHKARAFYESHAWKLTCAYTRRFADQDHAFVYYEKEAVLF